MYYNCCCNDPDYAYLLSQIKGMIEDFNALGLKFDSLEAEFKALKEYVNTYFDNLDLQDEVNKKLDEMYAAGQFEGYFGNTKYYVTPSKSAIPDPFPAYAVLNTHTPSAVAPAPMSNFELNEQALDKYDTDIKNGTIRVATLNIGEFEIERRPYLSWGHYMLKYLAESQSAIVGLQEAQRIFGVTSKQIYTDSFRDQVKTWDIPDYANGYFSQGFLSHVQIANPTIVKFKSQGTNSTNVDEFQFYTHCNVSVGDKVLSWYNTHLWYRAITSASEFAVWEKQRDELKAAMDADTNPYKICTGDMNIRENDPSSIGYNGLEPFKLAGYKLVNDGKFGTLWGSYAVDDIIVSDNISIDDSGMVDCYNPEGGIDHNLLYADITLK